MHTFAAALTPPPLPPCTQCVRIGLDPPPPSCVRISWMTPKNKEVHLEQARLLLPLIGIFLQIVLHCV